MMHPSERGLRVLRALKWIVATAGQAPRLRAWRHE
jgi:hypothetical protein